MLSGDVSRHYPKQVVSPTNAPTDMCEFLSWAPYYGVDAAVPVSQRKTDMRNFLEEITKNKYNQGGLTPRDFKPDTFESIEKSKLSFRQWSDEFSSWVERTDQDFETLMRLAAQMQEWDKDKFIAQAQQDYRLGAEKVAEFDKHIYFAMKRLTAGIAREIVDTSKAAGEAWYRVTDRVYEKNVQGATATASQLRELKRLSQIVESFHSLNVIRKLVKEFARQSQKNRCPALSRLV